MTFPHHAVRRLFGASTLAAAALAAALPATVQAQGNWPAAPIKIVVPFVPGGSNDILSRVLAQKLGARLGQPVFVDNRGGAGGTIGTDFVAKAQPDGYTLLFASTSIATNAASGKKLPYDLVKDLQPIGELGAGPFVIVVSNALKASSLQEFIALARAKPGSINYGTAGVGGINHLGTELFASAAGIQLTHVPYKGIGPVFTDLMAGTLQMSLPTLSSVAGHIHEGKMRGLAITGAQRSQLAPELPTVAEAGLPGFKLEVWWGVLGPAHMPPAVLKRLNEELNAVLGQAEVRESLAREGAAPQPGTPDEFAKLIRSEMVRWGALIKEKGIVVQ